MSEFLSAMFSISGLTGGIHAGLAVLCLILGPVIFLNKKGDARHRLMGKIWASMMLVLNISALMTYELNGGPNLFHFFAVFSLCTLIPGWYFILKFAKTRNPNHLGAHKELMVWAYFGLASAGVWQIATLLGRIDLLPISRAMTFNILGAATFAGAILLSLFIKRRVRT